jgi:large subunit ribosomal protein L9
MEVILLEHVRKLGNFGDVVNVKGGFARNFLLPRNKALLATDINRKVFEQKKIEIEKNNKEILAQAKKAFDSVDKIFITLIRQAGEDGKLFGSVSAKDITEEVTSSSKQEVSKNHIVDLSPIKYLGVHEVKIALHPEILATVRVIVARSDSEANEAKKNFLNPPKQKDAEKQLREDLSRFEAQQKEAGFSDEENMPSESNDESEAN